MNGRYRANGYRPFFYFFTIFFAANRFSKKNGIAVTLKSGRQSSASHLHGESSPARRKQTNATPGQPEICLPFFLLSIGAPIYVTIQKNRPIANSGMLKIQSVMSKVPPCRSDNFIHYNTPALKYQLHTFGCVNLIQSAQTSAEKSWEVLNKSQYASCLHIFRLIARKLLEIHQVFLRRFHTILRKICLRNLHIGFNQRFP